MLTPGKEQSAVTIDLRRFRAAPTVVKVEAVKKFYESLSSSFLVPRKLSSRLATVFLPSPLYQHGRQQACFCADYNSLLASLYFFLFFLFYSFILPPLSSIKYLKKKKKTFLQPAIDSGNVAMQCSAFFFLILCRAYRVTNGSENSV